jgi:hypothetical protein
MVDNCQQARRRDHLDLARPGGLAATARRADDTAAPARRGQRRQQHAGDTRQRPVQRHLAERGVTGEVFRRHRFHRRQQAQRDRQVEMAAFLDDIGRGEIDGDPPRRQPQAQRGERRPHPFARFADRLVRQADNGERRQPGGNRHLGLDLDDFDSVERDRANLCDHAPPSTSNG